MSEQKRQIFRQAALDKISSPDQLDLAVTVIKPYRWVILFATAFVVIGCLVWSLTGTIPTKVNGMGVLVNSGEMISISYPSNGIVKDVFVKRGTRVEKGQIIARIERLDLLEQIQLVTNKITNAENLYKTTSNYSETSTGLTTQMLSKSQKDLYVQLEAVEKNISEFEIKEAQMKSLFDDGLITELQYFETRNTLLNFRKEKQNIESKILDLGVSKVKTSGESKQTLMNLEHQINELRMQLQTLQSDYQVASRIVSDYAGTLLEVSVSSGSFVAGGSTIAIIAADSSDGTTLHTKFYFSANDGKSIKPGMEISICPTTVKQEEFGCIQGIITDVSSFPVSQDYLVNTLQNKSFVTLFLQKTPAPIEVVASLIPNPNNYSGLKWTSSHGPSQKMEPGIFCTGFVITQKQHPIELVVPTLKKKLLGIGDEQ